MKWDVRGAVVVADGVAVMRMRVVLFGVVAMLVATGGCRKKERFLAIPTSPVVAWQDLTGGQPVKSRGNAYRLLVSEATRGVFPSSLAVARVIALENEGTGRRELALDMVPEVDFLSWNSVFDDFRSISEVFPMNVMALDGAGVTVGNLLQAAGALKAGMLLVYTENHASAQDSELCGVLYDLPSARKLALIHASAHVVEPVAYDEQADSRTPIDEQEQHDPRLVAVHSFQEMTRDCLRALMANDQPVEPAVPDGWIPDREIEPLIWPPTEDVRPRRR